MSRGTTHPKISSFAASSEEDVAAFEALPEEEKCRLVEAEIEEGLAGKGLKLTAKDIIA